VKEGVTVALEERVGVMLGEMVWLAVLHIVCVRLEEGV